MNFPKDLDNELEKIMPHKIGDIVVISSPEKYKGQEWTIYKYLIGGYEVKNLETYEIIKVETKYVDFAELDLRKIKGHEEHNVVVSYIVRPEEDSYVYCRTCKKEITTRYKKIPKAKY
jgi:hypothetical protein